jgi:hypothetical protein
MERGEQEFAYTDDQLVSMIRHEIDRSETDYNTKIAAQREQSHRYYYGEPFGNERKNFSRHVSMDVFEGVEDVKAKILDTFTAGHQLLKFEQEMDDPVDAAQDATDYVHSIFFKQNRGTSIIEDSLHDALVAKLATAELCWHERVRVTPEIFQDVPADQLNVLLSQDPNIHDFKITGERTQIEQIPGPQGAPVQMPVRLVSGEIVRKEEVGQVKVNLHAPENVFIASPTGDPMDADCVILRYPNKTKGQLVAEGFDPELVRDISNTGREFDIDRQARHSSDDSYLHEQRSGEEERDEVDVDVAYIEIDMDGDYIPETWKITIAGDTLLDKEQVAKKPLYFWSPYRISHKSIGLSVADVLGDIQRTNSGLVRGVMDNIFLTNTSMKIADLSLIRNPRDLIDNPIGAVINSADPDAVKMVPQPQLNPATFDAIGLMLQQKQGRLGLTKLPAQQVISHQNSEDMINTLMAEGEFRVSKMARSYAEGFLKPLFIDIYNMGVEYGQVVAGETARGFRVLDPRSFRPTRHNMKVAVALTPEERQKRAQALMATYQTLGQDQSLAPLFGAEEKYALITDFFEAMGTGSPAYLKNPQSPEGQQAIQMAAQQAQQAQQAEMESMQSASQAQFGLAMAQIAKMQAEIQKITGTLQLDREKYQLDALRGGREDELDQDKFEFDKEISREELELEKRQTRNVVIGGA